MNQATTIKNLISELSDTSTPSIDTILNKVEKNNLLPDRCIIFAVDERTGDFLLKHSKDNVVYNDSGKATGIFIYSDTSGYLVAVSGSDFDIYNGIRNVKAGNFNYANTKS